MADVEVVAAEDIDGLAAPRANDAVFVVDGTADAAEQLKTLPVAALATAGVAAAVTPPRTQLTVAWVGVGTGLAVTVTVKGAATVLLVWSIRWAATNQPAGFASAGSRVRRAGVTVGEGRGTHNGTGFAGYVLTAAALEVPGAGEHTYTVQVREENPHVDLAAEQAVLAAFVL